MQHTGNSPHCQPRHLCEVLPEVLASLCVNRPETLLECFDETGDEQFLREYLRLARAEPEEVRA